MDAEYLGALTAARAALGLDDALPDLAASKADRLVRQAGAGACGRAVGAGGGRHSALGLWGCARRRARPASAAWLPA